MLFGSTGKQTLLQLDMERLAVSPLSAAFVLS